MLSQRQMAILRRIASGIQSFDPNVFSDDADLWVRLSAFQAVVDEIDTLYFAGMISVPSKHKEKQSGNDWVDHVMVNRLTDYGAETLSTHAGGHSIPDAG